jgi:hypothetical protein
MNAEEYDEKRGELESSMSILRVFFGAFCMIALMLLLFALLL